MSQPKLKAEKRSVLGKQVRKLRREGTLPANVYGKELSSLAIQVNTKEFETLYKEVGETGLVDLEVAGEVRPVLIKNLQMKYPLRTPLHVDFYQVNLKEKVKTMVPVEIIGEAKAVVDKVGTLLQTLNEIEVEALPTDLPEKIEVNVEPLAALDEQITVGDLKFSESVTVLTDAGQVVVKIAELAAPEPEPVAEETPAEGAEGETAAAEGEKTEEKGDIKSAEAGKEEKPKEEALPAGSPRGEAGKAGKKE